MDKNEHLESLNAIRTLMERSTRFISLSGLSGIFAGIIALIGAGFMHAYLLAGSNLTINYQEVRANRYIEHPWGIGLDSFVLLDFGLVLILVLIVLVYFTLRRVRKNSGEFWTKTTFNLLLNLFIPLATGGILGLELIWYGLLILVAPVTLIFYGLALVNGSRYTLEDIRYLGYFEIIIGLIAMLSLGNGLLFWALGFGIMHIVYGIIIYYKYEKE